MITEKQVSMAILKKAMLIEDEIYALGYCDNCKEAGFDDEEHAVCVCAMAVWFVVKTAPLLKAIMPFLDGPISCGAQDDDNKICGTTSGICVRCQETLDLRIAFKRFNEHPLISYGCTKT